MSDNQRVAVVAIVAFTTAAALAGIQQWRIKWMAMHVRALEAENKSLRQRYARERYCLQMLFDGESIAGQYTPAINLLHEARQTWDAMDPDQRDVVIRDQEYKTTEML